MEGITGQRRPDGIGRAGMGRMDREGIDPGKIDRELTGRAG